MAIIDYFPTPFSHLLQKGKRSNESIMTNEQSEYHCIQTQILNIYYDSLRSFNYRKCIDF